MSTFDTESHLFAHLATDSSCSHPLENIVYVLVVKSVKWAKLDSASVFGAYTSHL